MTTYYVSPSGSDGHTLVQAQSTSTPWKTLEHAALFSNANDTIKLMPGTYHEQLTIRKNGQTWTAQDTGDRPVIDGYYGPSDDRPDFVTASLGINHPRKNKAGNPDYEFLPDVGDDPAYVSAGLVRVWAENVTLSYLYIRRSAGSAIQTKWNSHNLTVDHCKIDFTYSGTFSVNGTSNTARLDGVTITNCHVTRSSMRKLAGKARYCETHRGDGLGCPGGADDHIINPATGKPYAPAGGADSVDVALKPRFTDNVVISGNIVAYCYGEGIFAAAGSRDVLIENNLIHNTYHSSIGVNGSKNCIVRGNRVFSKNTLPIIKTAPSGINIGDEVALWQLSGQRSENVQIYNNLVVGTYRCFDIRAGQYVTRLKNVHVAYNTWIGRPFVDNEGTVELVKLLPGGELAGGNIVQVDHYSFLYENNLHIRNGAYRMASSPVTLRNALCRNNAFTETPAGVLNKPSNVVTGEDGADVANDVPQHAVPLNVGYDVRAIDCDPELHDFLARHYHLADGADCIGAASDGSAYLDITPAVTTDYLGNTRGADPDIGWHEFGAGGAPGNVTISFTQKESPGGATVDGGSAPYIVYFDDTSTTSGGATITSRRWDFGDDTPDYLAPDGSEFAHTYAEPGVYQARLTVWANDGRSYTLLGAAFTVTGDQGASGEVSMATISQAIGTGAIGSTVEFDFGSALGGLVPKLVQFTVTNATATGTATADAVLGHGFAGGSGAQWAAALCVADAEPDTRSGRQHRDDACILTIDEFGNTTGAAKFHSAIANKMLVEIVDVFPASYLVTATAIAGDAVQAKVGSATGPVVGGSVTLSTTFKPDLLGVVTTNAGGLAAPLLTGAICLGLATSTENQYCIRWHEANARQQGTPRIDIQRAMAYRNVSANNYFLKLSGLAANGATLTPDGGDYDVPFGWFAVRFGARVDLRTVSTPTAAGNQDITLGWQPGHLQSLVTLANADTGSWTSSLAGSLGLHVLTGAFERTNEITSQYSTEPGDSSNTQSLIVASSLGIPLHTGGSTADGLLADASFLATGYRLAWTTVQATARRLLVLAIEAVTGAAPAGPKVGFSVTPLSGNAPLTVALTDTSDPNGDAIDSWEIDWGDDSETDTEVTRPTDFPHVYNEAGVYDVTVSATNGNGTTSLTKSSYIIIDSPQPPQLIGPIIADTITEESDNGTVLNPDSPQRGRQTHRLNLGALRIDADYTNGGQRELVEVAGKWQFAIVDGKLVVMDDAGNTGEIAIDWGGAPPPADGGTVNLQISSGNQDGHELNDGSVTVTATYIQQDAGTQEAALRFGPVNIPQGATITSALLSVYVLSTYDDPDSRIYAEDVNNATVLDTTTNFIQTTLLGAKTTAYTDWTATNIGTGWKTSPELKTVVQEVISRAGWASGNYLNLLFDANGAGSNLRFYSHDYGDHTYGAKLDITWSA